MKIEFPKLSYTFLVNFGIALFGILMLIIRTGYSYGPVFLFLISIPILLQRKTYQLNKTQWLVIGAFAIYPLVNGISILLDTGGKWRDFDLSSRVFLAIAIFLLLLRYRPSFKVIGYSFAIGAIGAGCLASYERFILGTERALSNATLVIQSGNISMAMGLICLSFMVYFYRKKELVNVLFFTFASLMGCLGSLLSGSRGGWVMMPVILLVFYTMYRSEFSKRFKQVALVILITFLCLSTLPQLGVVSRIEVAKNDIVLYTSGENKDTSVGIRFQLWQSAWDSFIEKPIFGWGKNGIKTHLRTQLEDGTITPVIYNFNSHAHNEYLNEMALRGSIGLISLLTIFFVPLTLFRRIFKNSSDSELQTIATAGIMVVLSTMDFCLSQAFLKHNSGVMFYFPILAIFLGFCFNKNHERT